VGVRLSEHPPYAVGPAVGSRSLEGKLASLLHAALWIRIEIEEWQLVREGHLHLVCSPEMARRGERWRRVELASHPLTVRDGVQELPGDAQDLLRGELRELQLDVFRQADLGLASEIGETRSAFQRRLLRSLGPLIQTRIQAFNNARPREPKAAPDRGKVAGAVSQLVSGIEHRAVRATEDVVHSAELGLLLVPEGVVLAAVGIDDRMIEGRPRPDR
jgi:hypothetical protein